MTIVLWLMAIIAVEAITEIIVSSEFFFKARTLISKCSNFFGKLFTCGYCMSVWVSVPIAFFIPTSLTGNFCFDFVIKLFFLHRASNLFHELASRYFKRLPLVFVLNWFSGQEQEAGIPPQNGGYTPDDNSDSLPDPPVKG